MIKLLHQTYHGRKQIKNKSGGLPKNTEKKMSHERETNLSIFMIKQIAIHQAFRLEPSARTVATSISTTELRP